MKERDRVRHEPSGTMGTIIHSKGHVVTVCWDDEAPAIEEGATLAEDPDAYIDP